MNNNSEILFYQTENGQTKLEVKLEDETVWLSQKQMSELFQKAKSTISEHVKNVYKERELEEVSTVRKFRTVQQEGKRNIERQEQIEFLTRFSVWEITCFTLRSFTSSHSHSKLM